MSSALLLFASLLAGAEVESAKAIHVSSSEVAQALVLNDARTDFYLSQKQIYLIASIERIVRTPVSTDGAAGPSEGRASGYAILIREEVRDHGDKRDVIIRCLFPESARDQLARLSAPGGMDHLIRGRLRVHDPARTTVVLGVRQIVADVVELVDCEIVSIDEAIQNSELSPFAPRRKSQTNDEKSDSREISE